MQLVFGNRDATHSVPGVVDGEVGSVVEVMPKGKRATTIEFPEDLTLAEAFKNVTDPRGVWASHATDGSTPAWAASDSPGLANLVAEHFGGIEVRELGVDNVSKGGGGGRVSAFLAPMLTLSWLLMVVMSSMAFLKTNAGNDFQAAQMGGSASATAVAKWVALTANTTAPAAGDTTLTAEIATGGGGLIRKAGTYAHTTGAASYTITTTFTANGSDSLPVTIGKRGIFDAAAAGNLVFTTLVSPTATISASGDSLTLTDTISL